MKSSVKLISGSSITINRLVQALKENDINVIVKDHTESARLAGFGAPDNDIELFVEEQDLSNARDVIKPLLPSA